MPNKHYAFDSRLEHRAVALAALTATATIATVTQRVAMRTDYLTLVGVESVDIANSDELYQFVIEVSNDSFSTVEVAAIRDFGDTAVRQSGAPDTVAGDFIEIAWSTEIGDTKYKDWRLRLIAAGTTPSLGFYAHSTVV